MALITTPLTERFDLELPVVAAPMSGVSDGRFAAAASNAGILGTVGVGGTTTEAAVRADLATAAETGRAYGVGLMAWALPDQPDQLDAVLANPPPLVSLSFGDYAPYLRHLQDAGCVVVTQVGSVEQAVRAEDAGVDYIVSRGLEGGGHGFNLVATLPLLQAVLARVGVPVLAAGGVGTARGLAAVLAAGAAGAWVGTAFVTCRESAFSDQQVARLGPPDETETAYSHVFDIALELGWPADIGGRTVHNAFLDTWLGREAELEEDEEARDSFRRALAERDPSIMPVYVGQGVGLLTGERPPVAEVVAELAGAADLLRAAARRVSDHRTSDGGVA